MDVPFYTCRDPVAISVLPLLAGTRRDGVSRRTICHYILEPGRCRSAGTPHEKVSDIPAGDGNVANLFLQCKRPGVRRRGIIVCLSEDERG